MLTKLDGDARGGAALSVASITGRPIMFASTGEGLDDFEPFHPDRMASRILDLGDILTLIEQAQQNFDEEEAAKVAEKFATDTFTLDDFLKQMQQLKNMGSIKGMLGMLPGARGMREQLENFDESEITRTEAIIQSMTLQERQLPKLLNGSRRLRIAKGSGTTVTEVNQLVQRFEQAAKMMKTVAKGGVPQVPGMGPIPGAVVRRQEEAGRLEEVEVGQPGEARGRERGAVVGGEGRRRAADRASGSARAGGRRRALGGRARGAAEDARAVAPRRGGFALPGGSQGLITSADPVPCPTGPPMTAVRADHAPAARFASC